MSVYVIGDENTVLGFALVGIDGTVVTTEDEARAALQDAVEGGNAEAEIVLITEQWAAHMRQTVDDLKMTQMRPLVLEIPAEEGEPTGKSLRELVRAAAGIRLGG